MGIYRPNGTFELDFNGNGVWDKDDKVFPFGIKGDTPVVGDWTADGRTKIGVFRKGFWLLDLNGTGKWDGDAGGDRLIGVGGTPEEIPIVGGGTAMGVLKWGCSGQMALSNLSSTAMESGIRMTRFITSHALVTSR